MGTYNKIMEKVWLVIAIATMGVAIYMSGKNGLSASAIYFLFPFIAMTLFFMRYYVRKKTEDHNEGN